MGFLATLDHLLNFMAPALGVGLSTALIGRLAFGRAGSGRRWWVVGLVNALLGLLPLAGGLIMLGRDGLMISYAGLVLVCGTSQWMLGAPARS